MSKRKCPYTWPHRSRKAMLEYLAEHERYHPMNSWNGGFVLAWNIKVYRFDEMGKTGGGESVEARFDDKWKEYLDENPNIFYWACGDATSHWTEGTWTNYPGIEQGEWKFGINGRSGGHMVLTDCPSWVPAPCRWRLFRMIWTDKSDYIDWLEGLSIQTLRQFYRAIRVLDHDLRTEACEHEVSYQFNWMRLNQETDWRREETCDAKKQEAARPDMYT